MACSAASAGSVTAAEHQGDPLGAGCVDDFAGHRQPTGHGGADKLGKPGSHAAAGQDADPGVGIGEHRPLGGDEEVTSEPSPGRR